MSVRFIWAAHAWVGDSVQAQVRIGVSSSGSITSVAANESAGPNDLVLNGVVQPGPVNAHSHAFHRLLRGRTHAGTGNFWTWRDLMYQEAARLDPDSYQRIATGVFGEMVAAGFTSVAEFHYVHHRSDGAPYSDEHAMERALAHAAVASGIRLTLLDTAYLAGGFGIPLSEQQRRFGDSDASAWLARGRRLRDALTAEFDPAHVIVGAAIHSVRAVPEDALAVIAAELDPQLPLHVHLSEQVAENDACEAASGLSPAGLLHRYGLLTERLSAVHATHLSPADIALLGEAGCSVVMCPSTEADLGDGIGPARELANAGATIALGTDQHAVIDPLLEIRALEHGERLRSQQRGRFALGELIAASSTGGSRSVGRGTSQLAVGAPCDLIEVASDSIRTAGSDVDQLSLTGTAADVRTVIIGGQVRARDGEHSTIDVVNTLFGGSKKQS